MRLRIPRTVVGDIEAHAVETLPGECCGFLLGEKGEKESVVREGRRARNVHPEHRESRYTIEPRQVLEVERGNRTGARLLGFYHSHPGHPARPSEFDRKGAWPWYVYVIAGIRDRAVGELTAWTFDADTERFDPVDVSVDGG